MIILVRGLCFLATKVPMNQHGGRLTLMMTLTRCGVSMQLVPPRIWIRRVIRITTFLALGSSASTLSGLDHHKEVAFPRRAALLLSTILFLAHHSQPSIQGFHRQAVEILIWVMVFQHLMTSQTPLALRRHLGHRWTVKLQEENQIFSGLQQCHLGHHSTVKLQEETRTHLGPLHLGHHSTVKLREETRTHLGLQGPSGCHRRLREKTDHWSAF